MAKGSQQNGEAGQGEAPSVGQTVDIEETKLRPHAGDSSQFPQKAEAHFEKGSAAAQRLKEEGSRKEEGGAGQERRQKQEKPQEKQSEGQTEQEQPETEERIQERLKEAQAEIEKLSESWSRERAEFMNYRKRVVQERQKQVADTVVSFLQELLPVLDNLDQVLAMEVQSEEVKKYLEGVSMIRENFIKILSSRKIKPIRPVNEEFDPQSMEAIATEEDAKFSKDTVLEVYQAGYLMEGEEGQKSLIRPARVRVGKAPV